MRTKLSRRRGPLYVQLKDILKDRILHSVYPLHSHLPTEPELADEFKVSRITVRQAVKELAQEGLVVTSSGKRTRIIRNHDISGRVKGKRFTEWLVEQGHKIEKNLLHAENVRNEEGTQLHRLFGGRSLRLERVYDLDGNPYIHFTHDLHDALCADEPADLAVQSLYAFIREHDIHLTTFKDQFAVEAVPAHVAARLHVPPGTPLLKRTRLSYDEQDRLIERSVGFYNTEVMPYHVDYN